MCVCVCFGEICEEQETYTKHSLSIMLPIENVFVPLIFIDESWCAVDREIAQTRHKLLE